MPCSDAFEAAEFGSKIYSIAIIILFYLLDNIRFRQWGHKGRQPVQHRQLRRKRQRPMPAGTGLTDSKRRFQAVRQTFPGGDFYPPYS